MKKRLDVLLVEQGLADSREKAKAIIMSGIVYVDNNKEDKAGTTFDETAKICRCFHWWFYRLYAAEWCGEGVFC